MIDSVLQISRQDRLKKLLAEQLPNAEKVWYQGQTTDATPTELFLYGDSTNSTRLEIPEDSVVYLDFFGMGVGVSDPLQTADAHFAGRVQLCVHRQGSSQEITVLGTDVLDSTGNPATDAVTGLATELVATVSAADGWVVMTATGLAATTINWYVELKDVTCMTNIKPDVQGTNL